MDKLEFKVKDQEYYIKKPSQKEINEAELIYKAKYAEALRLGAITGPEARKFMESRDIWTADDEVKLRKLFMDLAEKTQTLEKTESIAKGSMIIYDMEKIRLDIMTLNLKRNSILDNTAEAYADEHRLQHYVVICTYNSDGERTFENLDSYLGQSETDLARLSLTKTIHLIANDGKDFRYDWPEMIWRKKKGLVDDNLNPVPEKMADALKEIAKAEKKSEKQPKKKTK